MEVAAVSAERPTDEFDAAFHDRFEVIRHRLYAICRSVVGADDAEDVVQEAYLKARGRIGQLRNPTAFEAWVTRIAFNEARSVVRARARGPVALPDVEPRSSTAAPDPALEQLIDALPMRERMAVVLYYGYGYGMEDLARLLGISRINARTVLFRARRRLKAELEDDR